MSGRTVKAVVLSGACCAQTYQNQEVSINLVDASGYSACASAELRVD